VVELIGDDWVSPDRNDWELCPPRMINQPSGDTCKFTPGMSFDDRIGTVLFDAGTRRMEAHEAPDTRVAILLRAAPEPRL